MSPSSRSTNRQLIEAAKSRGEEREYSLAILIADLTSIQLLANDLITEIEEFVESGEIICTKLYHVEDAINEVVGAVMVQEFRKGNVKFLDAHGNEIPKKIPLDAYGETMKLEVQP